MGRSKRMYLRGAISILLSIAMLVMLVPGFGIKANAEEEEDYAAVVINYYDEIYCKTIKEAFEVADDDDEIILLKDVSIPKGETVKLQSLNQVYLNLNGYTLTNEGTIDGEFSIIPKIRDKVVSGQDSEDSVKMMTTISISNYSNFEDVEGEAKGYLKNSGIIKSNIYTTGSSNFGIEIDMTDGEISGVVSFYGGTLKASGGSFNGGVYIRNYYYANEGLDVTFSGDVKVKNLSFDIDEYSEEDWASVKAPSVGGLVASDSEAVPDDYYCLNLEGGYYDVDPKSYATYEYDEGGEELTESKDLSKYIKIDENKVENYKDCKVPSTWKADPEVYSWRIFSEGYSIADATVSAIADQTYTGKAITPAFTVKLGTTDLKQGTDFDVAWANNIDAGTATATITGKGSITGSKKVTFNIKKAANTLKVSKKKSTVKASKVKKAKQVVKKPIKVAGKGQGKLTYKKVKVNNKKFNKYFTVNKKTGKLTIKKGLKKGTYKVKISVTAAGDKNHNKITKKAVATIVVK